MGGADLCAWVGEWMLLLTSSSPPASLHPTPGLCLRHVHAFARGDEDACRRIYAWLPGSVLLEFIPNACCGFTCIETRSECRCALVPALLTWRYSHPNTPCTAQTTEDLIFLLANDSDEFNRWEAGQRITKELLMKLYDVRVTGGELKMDAAVVEAFRAVLTDKSLDKSFVAAAMSVPGEGEMVEALNTADPDAVHAVRDFVTTSLAEVCTAGM